MLFARDIKTKIITRMQDSTNGLSALVSVINLERSESTEVPYQVNAKADEGQYPLVFIDLGNSNIVSSVGSKKGTYIENFNVDVTAVLKGNEITKLQNDCENYIEAIMRSIQGFSEQDNAGSYVIEANSIQRDDLYTDNDMTVRAVTVTFTIYANQL